MEENKNLNPETELETQTEEVTEEISEEVTEDTTEVAENNTETEAVSEDKPKKAKKVKAPKKKLLKNQALFKKGSYSVAITAVFIAAVIVINVLVGALSDRFVLEFDMSTEKNNSISEENIEYIRDVEDEVKVIVCADPESYVGGYMAYYAQQYNVTEDATDYYKQTINLIDRYADYNKKIKVEYMDTQSAEFAEVAAEYESDKLAYGDIIVSCEKNGNKRHKKVTFTDIYSLSEDSTYAAYGYTTATVGGNNIETALTSAIAYVTSSETKKLAVLTGHSTNDYTSEYQTLLKNNNYEIDIISDAIISSIDSKYDAIIIAAPTKDFIGSELDAISAFLDNGGKLDKGLIFIGDVTAPYLTNLYDLLAQWGIAVDDGILFETNESNHMPDDPMTLGSYSSGKDDITESVNICITGNNIPLSAAFESQDGIRVTSLVATPETVVAAPKGTAANWTGADKYKPQAYSNVIQAVKEDYNDDNQPINSYVMAFSSVEFIYSEYNEQASVSNKDITLAVAERAAGVENSGISFVSKTITNESFADKVTESSTGLIRIIFMFLLPLISIVAGIVIYIKRRNA